MCWKTLTTPCAVVTEPDHGTPMGGCRIVKAMGTKITKLQPFGGFCAETGGGLTILIAPTFGIPVSTTHTITTIPFSAFLAALFFWILPG